MSQCKYATEGTAKPRTIRRHNAGQCVCYGVHKTGTANTHPATAPVTQALTGKADTTFDDNGQVNGGEFIDVQTDTPAGDWTHIFQRFNLNPTDFTIVDDTVRCSTWQQSKALDDGTRDVVNLYSYRARFTRRRSSVDIDPVGILTALRANNRQSVPHVPTFGYQSTFVLSINDIQLGQSYNGGSPATIKQFHEFIADAVDRIKELRAIGRRLERLVIVVGGDLGEGCVIYPNQAFNLDLDRKQQSEGVIALLLHGIDTLAPLFEFVTVLACKGNHGEHRINGKMTTLNDNDDTHAVEMAKLALSRDPDMQHIDWIIAGDEAAVSTFVYDWVLSTTHGDVFAKGVSGPTTERKAHLWMKNMAGARKHFGDLADTDVLVTHHFHHDEMADWGDTLWRQTPSQDRGSPGFSQATGTYSVPGMLTWVMTPESRWQDEAVLRQS